MGAPRQKQNVSSNILQRRGASGTVFTLAMAAKWSELARRCGGAGAATNEMGLAYDPTTRKGILVTMPMAGAANHGGFLFCVSYEEEGEAQRAYQQLGERFA